MADKKVDDAELTPRRATRTRNKPKKYDAFLETSPVKRKSRYVESSDEEFNEAETPKPKGKNSLILH